MNYLRFIVLFYSGNPNAPQIRSTARRVPCPPRLLARWAWPRTRPVRCCAENSGQAIAVEMGYVRRHAAAGRPPRSVSPRAGGRRWRATSIWLHMRVACDHFQRRSIVGLEWLGKYERYD